MKNAFKKFINLILSLIFIFSSVICMLETLGVKTSSVSPSLVSSCLEAKNSSVRQTEINDSLFLVDLSSVKVSGDNVYIYDKQDSTIKIIDKNTNTYRLLNNHYRFYNLKDMIIYNDVLMMIDNVNNQFSCINKETFEEVEFSSQENLTTMETAKSIEIVNVNNKDYLLLCPIDPTVGYFELAEISLTNELVLGNQTKQVVSINNINKFKITENWSNENNINSYDEVFVTEMDGYIYIMLRTGNKIFSFPVDTNDLSIETYPTLTAISGIEPTKTIQSVVPVNLNNERTNLAVIYSDSIDFYDITAMYGINLQITAEKNALSINLSNFSTIKADADNNLIALISSENQALKMFDINNQTSEGYLEQNVVNEQIFPYYWSNASFKYIETTAETKLLELPYSKSEIINIPVNSSLAIIGEGRYSTGEQIYGWNYVIYTVNNQNYFGYVSSIDCNDLMETTYLKKFITVLGYTKLYSLPSVFVDSKNAEIKTIANSSRLEVLSSICDYFANETSYLLVKVNGGEIGFIDRSRVLTDVSLEDKVIPNATVKRDNSEIFTSKDSDKEVIMKLNSGYRVKVIGKRDTVTNYTKVTLNDNEGNVYTGYIYTHNLEPDSWSTLQILGMVLVIINVILLAIIIIIKNKVTR